MYVFLGIVVQSFSTIATYNFTPSKLTRYVCSRFYCDGNTKTLR